MRRGEFITAGILAVLSIYMMWKSTELDVGYISGEGPGGAC
jgi:putative tricarboxylic transport membrane protein